MCKTVIYILNIIDFYCGHYMLKISNIKEKDDDDNNHNNNDIFINLEKGLFMER